MVFMLLINTMPLLLVVVVVDVMNGALRMKIVQKYTFIDRTETK